MIERRTTQHVALMLVALLCACSPRSVHAQAIALDRPGEREFVVDKADLITPEDEQRIRQICDQLLTDTASPILVVTLESMAKYSTRGTMTVERFARILF